MDARKITGLLLTRHKDSLCVPECKNGATHMAKKLLRMDMWVMERSWAHPLAIAYEIKISRQDFLKDNKWHHYLDYCNEFYFVCPRGLIDPDELPPEAGLLYVTTKGNKLYCKKKAMRRIVTVPESLYKYVLMCRTKIDAQEPHDTGSSSYWRDWLASKKENRQLGYKISKAIGVHVKELEQHNDNLVRKMESYDDIRLRVEELGFDPKSFVSTWQVCNKLNEFVGAIPSQFISELTRAKNNLENLLTSIENEKKQL